MLLSLGLAPVMADTECALPETVPEVTRLGPDTLREIIKTCIEEDADFTAPGPSGHVPFGAIVAATDHPTVLQTMLDHGADPNVDFGEGRPAFFGAAHPAREMQKHIILEKLDILGRAGADFNRKGNSYVLLINAAGRRDTKMVRLLLNYGADPDAVDGNRVSALFITVSGRCDSLTGQALLDAGASVKGLTVDKSSRLFDLAESHCQSNVIDRAYLQQLRNLKEKALP